jgi:hypothetical protein
MTNETSTSRATVATDRPERYGKQLVSHLGRRNGGEWSAEQHSGWIDLATGKASVGAGEGALLLEIRAPAEELPRLEEVIADHLVRFGERDELTVDWSRADTD